MASILVAMICAMCMQGGTVHGLQFPLEAPLLHLGAPPAALEEDLFLLLALDLPVLVVKGCVTH